MIKINVIINNISWQSYIKNPQNYIEKKIKKFNSKNKKFKNKSIYCTLLLSGNNKIKELNKKFRNKNKSTDVLSFPFYGKRELKFKLRGKKELYLGDIIINIDKLKNKKDLKTFKYNFDELWIHGLLHLFGYDHKKVKDFKKMSLAEKQFFNMIK